MIFRDVSIIAIGALYKQQFVFAKLSLVISEEAKASRIDGLTSARQWQLISNGAGGKDTWLLPSCISIYHSSRIPSFVDTLRHHVRKLTLPGAPGVILRGNFTKLTVSLGAVNSTCVQSTPIYAEKKKRTIAIRSSYLVRRLISARTSAVGALFGRVEGIRLYRLLGCAIPICYRGTRRSVMRRAATSW